MLLCYGWPLLLHYTGTHDDWGLFCLLHVTATAVRLAYQRDRGQTATVHASVLYVGSV